MLHVKTIHSLVFKNVSSREKKDYQLENSTLHLRVLHSPGPADWGAAVAFLALNQTPNPLRRDFSKPLSENAVIPPQWMTARRRRGVIELSRCGSSESIHGKKDHLSILIEMVQLTSKVSMGLRCNALASLSPLLPTDLGHLHKWTNTIFLNFVYV